MLPPQDREVLDLVVDDYFGLWELVWRLATVFGDSLGSTVDVARASVQRLSERALVTVCVREWLDDDPMPIERSGRSVDLSAPDTWAEPRPGEPQVLLIATDLGRAELLDDGA